MSNVIRRLPPACENDSNNTNNINITRIEVGGSLRGEPVPYLNTHPQAADGGGRLPMGAEGAGTLVLFFEEASRETLLFHRLTPTPKGPKAVQGCPTLALFFEEASHETNIFIDFH